MKKKKTSSPERFSIVRKNSFQEYFHYYETELHPQITARLYCSNLNFYAVPIEKTISIPPSVHYQRVALSLTEVIVLVDIQLIYLSHVRTFSKLIVIGMSSPSERHPTPSSVCSLMFLRHPHLST